MIDKKTQLFIIGIFLMLFGIFIFMIWYTSNIKIQEDRAKPNFESYDIEEGINILMNGVEEYKSVIAIQEAELYYWKNQIDALYSRYFPKGAAQDTDSQFRAIKQRLSMASFFGESDHND